MIWPESIGYMSDSAATTKSTAAIRSGKRGSKREWDWSGDVTHLSPKEKERQCRADLIDCQHDPRHGGKRRRGSRPDRRREDRDHHKLTHAKTGRQQYEYIARDIRCRERAGRRGPRQLHPMQRAYRQE